MEIRSEKNARGFPRERVSSVPVGKCESDDGEDEDRDDRDVPIDAGKSEDALDGIVGEVGGLEHHVVVGIRHGNIAYATLLVLGKCHRIRQQ